ncbi:MAG: tRNA lysidine(34) synthetase TilS [Bacteroidaceae bacterium]
MFNDVIARYIERETLFTLKDKVLVALSGGADSVALFRSLLALGYECEAAHCNFHLRGEESDRDENFVRMLCGEYHIPLHLVHFDTLIYADEHHLSVEMAARELRYDWFELMRKQTNSAVVAVAHHRDDSVETFLLNLMRGTGINGLKGIRSQNGFIVRPLLDVDRESILCYLSDLHQPYITDSTNLQDEYTRNKIRLNLIPLMETINPSVKESISAVASRLSEAALIYNKGIEDGKIRVMDKEGIVIDLLLCEPSPKALLFEILHPLGFNASQLNDVYCSLRGQSGKRFLSKEWSLIKDRTHLLLRSLNDDCSSELQLLQSTDKLPSFLSMSRRAFTSDFIIPKDKNIACLDADKLHFPLSIRYWQQGDKFVPFGMKGKKKVSDYLTDRKYSLYDKERLFVLCSGEEIVWLVGERADNRFKVDETTREICLITNLL